MKKAVITPSIKNNSYYAIIYSYGKMPVDEHMTYYIAILLLTVREFL